MGFKVNTNIDALNAYYALKSVTDDTVKSQTRLSTGKKINHVWDDTSGFNIGKSLETKAKVMKSVQSNIGSAKDMLSTAESSLLNIKDILTTIETKLSDASNPTSNRESIAKDIEALTEEIAGMLKNTKFNNTSLLVGTSAGASALSSNGAFAFQVSDDTNDKLLLNYASGLGSSAATDTGTDAGSLFIGANLANALSSMAAVATAGVSTDAGTKEIEFATAIASLGLTGGALATFKTAIDDSLQKIGNLAQRLDARDDFMNVAVANAESNYSRLFDADYALEQLNVTKGQIMQQAGIQMMSQLSTAPQQVLSLFQ
ncbi:MAG TPA: flagellin [Ignavibacteriales bacterium]|jgi:flagellin|nr:flagellin [Ignavibacteriales bacterium]